MNKHCYRIIFSRTHGELRVVSELASSCSTQPGQSRGKGGARVWVTVRSAVVLIGLALFAGPVLASGIVADGQLAPSQRPEVINTQNGLQQVNINAPNQAGISHNQYQQFDVGRQGAILNNSAVMTSTQLGGYIQGNARLDPNKAPARVIINEVNNNNPSQLRGFLEVAGGRAQVVVANPSGIVCDGCGTINAGRMTLTTGKPQLNADGSLAGYQVERGTVRIEGGGLNGDPRHDTEYADVLARAVEVNAGIWAREEINVVAGRNQISADGKTVTALAGDGSAPATGIDMGQLGGMYSGHIRMVGTEAGVGVRNQGGHLQAGKTLTVSSEGKLSWQPASADPVTQAGGDITLTARDDVEHQGKLFSGGQLSVQSRQGGIKQSGTLAAAGNVTLRAAQGIESSGHLLAGSDANSTLVRPADLTLESQGDVRASGSLLSQKKVSVTGRNVDVSQSRLAAGQAQLTAQGGDVRLQQAKVDSDLLTVESQRHVYAQQAEIRAGRWQITADSLFSQGGIWSQAGAGESRFSLTGALDNTDGSIEASQLSLSAAALNNLRGRMVALDNGAQHWRVSGLLSNQYGVLGSNGSLQLDAGRLDNLQGTLQSQSDLTLLTQQGVSNDRGKLLAGGSLALNSQGVLSNQGGEIRAQSLQLTAQGLNNAQGQVTSQGRLQLSARGSIDNQQGLLEAGEALDVSTGGNWDNRGGSAVGVQQASVSAGSLDNRAGKLQSGGGLTLNTAGNVDNNAGILTAQQDLNWQGGALSLFSNDAGTLLSGGAMSLSGGQLNNRQQGIVQSQRALALNLAGAWDNQGGKLASGGGSTVRAGSLINAQGEIQALDSLDMQFTRALDNRNGNIFSQQTQRLQAENIFNHQGWIGSLGTLTATSQGFDNREGEVISQQDADLTVTALDNQRGTLQSGASLVLRAAQDIANQGGKISAQARLWLQGLTDAAAAGVLHNAGGQLLAGEQLRIQARGIDNQQSGLLYSQKQLQLTLSEQLDNRQGRLQSGEAMQIRAAQLLNAGGVIDSQQQLGVQLSGVLDNARGTVRANQDQHIVAGRILNAQGVFSSLGNLRMSAEQLDNTGGTVISQGAGDYHFSSLSNRQGKVHSGGALTLRSDSVDNQGGQLVSSQDMTLDGENIDNGQRGIISSQAALTLRAGSLSNRDGGLLIGTTHTDLRARTLDNTAGRLQSAGTLTLSLLDTLNNREGAVLANSNLSINASGDPLLALLNQRGTVQSGGALTAAARSFDNAGGTLLSQQALQLTVDEDYTHRAGDTLSSNTGVTLRVNGVLTNLADWLLPGDLHLYSTHLTNLASLIGNTVQLTTGTLLNQGRIEGDTLTIDSDSLDNRATLMADNLTVRSRVTDNQGREALIAATQNISLITGERLTNRDGALIYSAGNLQLSSGDLIENRASNIEAEGDVTLTARRFDNLRQGLEITRDAESSDYSWHRYNYYWRSYGEAVNTDVSTMAPTTQQLSFRDDAAAATNPYGTLLNIDAAGKRAEVRVKDNTGKLVSVWVNYLALIPNIDGSYDITFYETRGPRQRGVPTPYHNTVWWNATDSEKNEIWSPDRFLDIASAPYVVDYNNLRERTVTGTVTRDRLESAGTGAYLLSGGNMVLNIADQLLNDASTISANGNLTIDGTASIINRGYSVNERRQEYIVDHYDQATSHWYPTYNLDQTTALTTIDGVISGNGNVTIGGARLENTTVNQAQISSVEAAQNAAAAERAEWERNPLAVNIDGGTWQAGDTGLAPGSQPLTPGELALTDRQHLGSVATSIPDNALFRQQTAPSSPYLVVTDPRFASKNNFLSSDYLLQRVGYDPAQVHKRLGDGYYEQRLVREQLLSLTGRQSLQGEDAMAQYQSLMNNGIKVAADFQLVPGVALTPSQIAALQQDIVWLVSETVDTADGPQTVWVPKVYLAGSTLSLTGDGAVIAGGNLQLSTDSVSNAGNLFADKALSIDAGQFLHQGGDIRADTINVQADSISLSTNLQDALRQASMSARDISLSGGDISLQGAKLSAADNLSLSASNSLAIGTARSAVTADLNVIAGAMGNRTSAGTETAGSRQAQVQGEWQQALGSSLTAGGNLSLKAGQDITVQGSQASAGGKTQVVAGGNVSLLSETTTNDTHLNAGSRTSAVSNSRREETLHSSALGGDGGVTIIAGGDFLAEGARVESAAGGIGLSAEQVTIKEARQQLSESDSERNKVGNSQSQRQVDSASNLGVGSLLSARDDVTVIAREGALTVQGSTIQSDKGTAGLKAAGDITLAASHDEHQRSEQGSSSSKGAMSSSERVWQKEEHSSTASGSLVSGQEVVMLSGRDISVAGSNIVATDDVFLTAGNNITLGTADSTRQSSSAEETKTSGLSGTGGIGVSYGTSSLKLTETENSVISTGSTVGSTQGSVTLNAGNSLTVKGSDVLAGKDISLTAKEVSILAADNQSEQTRTVEQKQSGLTLALSGAVGSALNTAVSSGNDATTASSGRLAALDGMKAALGGVQAYQGYELGTAEGSAPESLFGINLSYGSQSSKSEQKQTTGQSQGSTLTAGGNLNIHATEGDISVQGSQLSAGKDIGLTAARDVNLWSGVNTSTLEGENESHGSSVGVGLNFGQGTNGLTLNASVNKGKGSENGRAVSHTETTVNAGNHLTIVSGRDTTLTGAQVSGDKVTMDVGRNLTLTSEQDSDDYDSKQQNVSAGGSVGFGSASASLNMSKDKIHSTYSSVIEQTGVFAGKGGFDITVGEHTQLSGAVIGSTASADINRLDTGTLGFTDIHNRAEYEVEHQSVGISSGGNIGGQFAGNMANGLLTGVNGEGSASSVTKSAVSEGSIIIRDADKQTQDVAELSRDVENANQTLTPIFDKEKEQQRLKEAQKIGEIGSQVIDIARTQGDLNGLAEAKKRHPDKTAAELRETDVYKAEMAKYGTGSDLQQGLQAATAAIQGLAGGDLKAAIAGGAAPYLAEVVKNMTTNADGSVNVAANAMAHAVVGAVVAQLQGNGALAGAAGAAGGELAARLIADQLYPGVRPEDLTESQKQTVSVLGTLAAGLAGGLAGDSTADAVAGAQAGKNAVENNAVSDIIENKASGVSQEEKYQNAQNQLKAAVEEFKAQNCAGLGAEACSAKMDAHRNELLAGFGGFGLDFTPVVGDIKSFAEAQGAIDYLAAVVGLIPGAGDVAGKAIKGAQEALKKGDVSEASKLINKASEEIQAVKPLDVGSYKELKDRAVVGDGLEHDHIPSFAALKKAKEAELGRPLNDAETKNLYQNATAVEVPKDVHQSGPTYGGKNTAAQVEQDAANLCGAVCRDTDALRRNMIELGYDPKLVDDAIHQIVDRNRQAGVIK